MHARHNLSVESLSSAEKSKKAVSRELSRDVSRARIQLSPTKPSAVLLEDSRFIEDYEIDKISREIDFISHKKSRRHIPTFTTTKQIKEHIE